MRSDSNQKPSREVRYGSLTGAMAKAEPKKLRWALWHTAGKITTTGRRQTMHLDRTWPWAATLQHAFQRLSTLHFTT